MAFVEKELSVLFDHLDVWAIFSRLVCGSEFLLALYFLVRPSRPEKSTTWRLLEWTAMLGGLTMHISLEASGLQLGRFSYLMCILYLPVLPAGWAIQLVRSIADINCLVQKKLCSIFIDPFSSSSSSAFIWISSCFLIGSTTIAATIYPLFLDPSHIPILNDPLALTTSSVGTWVSSLTAICCFLALLSLILSYTTIKDLPKKEKLKKISKEAAIFLVCCLILSVNHHVTRSLSGTGQLREFHKTTSHQAASRGDLDTAVAHYKLIVHIYPTDAEARCDLALFHDGKRTPEDLKESRDQFQFVVDHLDPLNIKALSGLLSHQDRRLSSSQKGVEGSTKEERTKMCLDAQKVADRAHQLVSEPCGYQQTVECEQLKSFCHNYVLQRLVPSIQRKWTCT